MQLIRTSECLLFLPPSPLSYTAVKPSGSSEAIRRPSTSGLTFGSMLRYTAPMPIQFILPKKFTRAQIEWRVDELALRFQGTQDKKIIAQIAALNRVLAKMEAESSDSCQPKNRQ